MLLLMEDAHGSSMCRERGDAPAMQRHRDGVIWGGPQDQPQIPHLQNQNPSPAQKNPIPGLSRAMLPAQHKKLGTGMRRGMETGSIHTA